MHISNLLTLTTLLLSQHASSALISARIWSHFYPDCSVDALPPGYSDTTSPAVDVRAGTCEEVNTPLPDTDKVDYISIDAELLVVQPFQQCNVTVHEVPDCVDPPLIEVPVQNRHAGSECTARNFRSYSSVWVRLDCKELGTGAATMGRFVSSLRKDSTVRRRKPIHI